MGLLNWVAVPLSHEQTLSDKTLTAHLLEKFPEEVPLTFKILPLLARISSAICYLLQTKMPMMQLLPTLTSQPTWPGINGSSSSSCVASVPKTPSLMDSHQTTKSNFSWPLPKPSVSAPGASPLKDLNSWLATHAKPPSIMWARPSPPPDDLTPDLTAAVTLSLFYSNCSRATKTMTQESHSKKVIPWPLIRKMCHQQCSWLSSLPCTAVSTSRWTSRKSATHPLSASAILSS
jgi:hypothetical protein